MSDSAAAGRLAGDLASLDPETLAFILSDWQLWARDDQLPPATTAAGEDWRVWLILGGRGAGKTRSGAEWVRAKALGIPPLGDTPARRIALVGETLGDVRRVMIEGVSGLLAIHREDERPALEVSKSQLVWPNGAVAQMFSAEDPDSLRGPQFDAAWCDAFVNAVLGASGVEGTGKLTARSFLNFGTATDRPQPGDIVVLTRGNPNGSQGHVGFFQGFDRSGRVLVRGGNQRDGVNTSAYDARRVLGFRTAGTVTEQTASLPNYGPAGLADIDARLMAIKDPKERKATQDALNSYFTLQKKQMDAQREQVQSWAEGELMRNPGLEISKLPLDYQQALGASGMTTLMNYQEKLRSHGEPQTDDRTLYDLQTEFANDPEGFANIDLFQYRDKLSNSDWEKVRGWRQDALSDKRKAREAGTDLSQAFTQAQKQLDAVGLTTTGKKGSAREDAAQQVVKFQNALASELEAFKRQNDNRAPTQIEVQSMINKLLLPVVIKTPGMIWGENETSALLFQGAGRGDDATVEIAVEYDDIPFDLRRGLAIDLERELGRKPSQAEVVQKYEDFVLDR
ncbi:TIGR02594 family protein [Hyphomicrobium sp.]|uniref:TIGR02594 family protein n=1 Tax=Hyphomicrobium sp. TaxID=82 RepID=UPI003FA581BF